MSLPPLPAWFDPDKEFPIRKKWLFFNHAGVSPIPARSAAAIRRYAQQLEDDSYLTGQWYKLAEVTRNAAARLLNADPSEIAFAKNTSEGLSFVSNGFPWNPGDEILSANVEYPSNVYPWMDAAQRYGVKHIMVPERNARIDIQELLDAVTPRTRMIALSHVEYASGYRNDLTAIGQFCRKQGILFCVDAIQACGALPIDVQAMNIDFLSASGHKWMLGPEGLGLFFCRKELITQVRPEVGWMNVINATNYGDYDFTLRSDAKRFECGGYNLAGVFALGQSLELLLEIGIETVSGRIKALTDQLIAGLKQKGYHIVSPRGETAAPEWSGIVSFTSPTHPHAKILADLEQKHIILVEREKRLRAAPHFYNDQNQIQVLLDALPGH